MQPEKQQNVRKIAVQDSDDEDDTGSTFSDASDISWEETAAAGNLADINLDSLLPLNTARLLEEAAVLEDCVAEFLQAAPALEVADVEFEQVEDGGLLVADSSEMRVTAVESRTCWPLQVVHSSAATVLLLPLPASAARGSLVGPPPVPPPPKPPAPLPNQLSHQQLHQPQQLQPRSLLAMLTQPKLVPHNPEMHTVHLVERPRQAPRRASLASRLAAAASAATGLQFQPLTPPPMTRCEKVPYLHGFRFGDTYQLHSKLWLLPQLLCGALALTGILLTLVGIIMLQINKYLVSLCDTPEERINCLRKDEESITSVTMSIGVGTAGGGLSLILICAIVFLHAFCVIYNEGEHHQKQENVSLHVPGATCHADMFDFASVMQSTARQQQKQLEETKNKDVPATKTQAVDEEPLQHSAAENGSNLVRCQSQYDNLQEVTDDFV